MIDLSRGIVKGPGRPERYLLANGSQVPSVTTITGLYGNSSGLIHWAHKCGLEQKDMEHVRQEAADTGTCADWWITDTIHGDELRGVVFSDAICAVARQGLDAFKRWQAEHEPAFLATQLPLVSEKHRYGGTLDALCRLGGRLWLVDWKLKNGLYAQDVVQVSAYASLLAEHGVQVSGAMLLRMNKGTLQFDERVFDDLLAAAESFALQRRLYEVSKTVNRVLGSRTGDPR